MFNVLIFATMLLGCDNFDEVQQADTIDAYEAYLAEHPTGRWTLQASSRLENLSLEQAKETKTLAAYDTYLEKFPDGKLKERAMSEREYLSYDEAQAQHSIEAWERYIKDYPRAKRERKDRAKSSLKALKISKDLPMSEIRRSRANLAEDPHGPLNGWQFQIDLTNNTKEMIGRLVMTLVYLDDNGRPTMQKRYPIAARYWQIPIESEYRKPMMPGETRTWTYTDGNIPDDWSGKVRIYPALVRFGPDE